MERDLKNFRYDYDAYGHTVWYKNQIIINVNENMLIVKKDSDGRINDRIKNRELAVNEITRLLTGGGDPSVLKTIEEIDTNAKT